MKKRLLYPRLTVQIHKSPHRRVKYFQLYPDLPKYRPFFTQQRKNS